MRDTNHKKYLGLQQSYMLIAMAKKSTQRTMVPTLGRSDLIFKKEGAHYLIDSKILVSEFIWS